MTMETALAFAGYIMAVLALVISLYVWLLVDELVKNGQTWIKLNQDLKQKIDSMDRNGPTTPWKK